MKDSSLTYYRERILESIQDLNLDRLYNDNMRKSSVSELINLVEAYSIICNNSNDSEAINEANSLCKYTESIVNEYNFRKKNLNEGFENPFDEPGDRTIEHRYDDVIDIGIDDHDIKIGKVKLWNDKVDNKVMYRGGKMVAGKFFGIGDTIEECPVRLIYEKDLYSENIRDFAFDIDKKRGVYAIPFGYASFYRNSKDCNVEPNAEYEYVEDGDGKKIRIFATRNIKKGHEIVLYAEDDDFQNEIKPGQFDYSTKEIEPYYAVKNVRIA